jgi:proline iminopeptidase
MRATSNFDETEGMTTTSISPSAIAHSPGRLVTVRDTQLWVETEGLGDPIILLVGGPANSHVSFHPFFSALANQYQVIYYDYRGRGRSDRSADVHTITFASDVEDLEGLRQVLGFERISLYGFSYGGMVAQAYALAHPERVSNLILANTVHSAEMWQQNHENLNRELGNQYPELWQQIQALRAEGRLASDPEMESLLAKHGPRISWY